ncbi:MAG: tRNA lysidine(34) synthetase TilS [Planctomycetes bacterium]|nr:tRNA lysidine(34) synthetase TilS [Planctomycetota bacterium]
MKMLTEFENKIADFIAANKLFEPADRVILAISGGADSTALLHVLFALKTKGVLDVDFVCVHFNHQLRGFESDEDASFVAEQAGNLNLKLTIKKIDVKKEAGKNKLSIETAARKLRIANLVDIARANNCNRIVTAHQKNDNAETILQRLARGTGFRGLGGIWPARKLAGNILFVRPLLSVTRKEIVEYLEQRNLEWRTDKTNADCKYRRNYIRHRLMPEIQKNCKSSVAEQLFDLSCLAQKFHNRVCSNAEKAWQDFADYSDGHVMFEIADFLSQPEPVKIEIIRLALAHLGCGERSLTQGHYKKIIRLAEQNISGKKIVLPNGFVVWKEYKKLFFALAKEKYCSVNKSITSVKLQIPCQIKFVNCLIEASVFNFDKVQFEKFRAEKTDFIEWLDFDKVELPLKIRFRRSGDRFVPLGMADDKKVGKFLTNARVPQKLRRKIMIISDGRKILWVWPIRINEGVKVDGKTKNILQLKICEETSDID